MYLNSPVEIEGDRSSSRDHLQRRVFPSWTFGSCWGSKAAEPGVMALVAAPFHWRLSRVEIGIGTYASAAFRAKIYWDGNLKVL